MNDGFLTFAEESGPGDEKGTTRFWKIMVIDDEKSIHDITSLSLKEFTYEGVAVSVLSMPTPPRRRKPVLWITRIPR